MTEPTGINLEVPASKTFVDFAYGRPLNEKRARGFAKNFSWISFVRPSLSARHNGHYAILDGQHRIRAAVIAYGPSVVVPVVVHHGLSLQEEAAEWSRLNSGVKPNTRERLRSDYAAGDDDAVKLVNYLRELGFGIHGMGGATTVTPSVLKASTTARTMQRRDWPNTMRTFRLIAAVWFGQPVSLSNSVIAGLFKFLDSYENLDENRVRQVLALHTPQQAITQAQPLVGILQRDQAVARVLLGWYNNRLVGHNKLDPARLGV